MIRDERKPAFMESYAPALPPTVCELHSPNVAPYDCPGCGPGLIRRLREATGTGPEPAGNTARRPGRAEVESAATRTVSATSEAVLTEARKVASEALERSMR